MYGFGVLENNLWANFKNDIRSIKGRPPIVAYKKSEVEARNHFKKRGATEKPNE